MFRVGTVVGAVLVAALSIPAPSYANPRQVAPMALAQTWSHPPAGQYDPYVGRSNKDGESCCNGHDCRMALSETIFDILPGGGYRVRANNDGLPEGMIIPEGKVVEDGPDGNWHVCMTGSWNGTQWDYKGGRVRCLMIPNGGV